MKKLCLLFALVLALAASFAQTPIPFTATYSFSGSTGHTSSLAYNGTQYSGISMGNIEKKWVTSVSSDDNFRASGWGTNMSSPHIGFTIYAVQGYKFTVNSITFGLGRDGSGTTNALWRGSGNYTLNLKNYSALHDSISNSNGILTNPDREGGWTGNVLSLVGVSGYQDITTNCNFRLYLYGAKSSAGAAGLQGPITITGTYTFSGTHPAIEVSPTSLTGFNYEQGNGPSAIQSFTVSGAGLGANESILLSAPDGYGLSLTEAGPYYAASNVFSDGSGNVASTTVYVRLDAGLPVGDYNGNVEAGYYLVTPNVKRFVALSGTVSDQTLPVTLSHFSATLSSQNYVQLTWTSQSESNLLGYNVFRSDSHDLGSAAKISDLIEGTNTSQTQIYAYYDKELPDEGTYYYWLQHVDLDGSSGFHGPVSVVFSIISEGDSPGIPTITKLGNAYPNPFNPHTTLQYQLKDPGRVEIDIYNVRGQIVRSFSRYHDAAGRYSILWNGCDDSGKALLSGVYLYRMRSGDYCAIKKLVMQK